MSLAQTPSSGENEDQSGTGSDAPEPRFQPGDIVTWAPRPESADPANPVHPSWAARIGRELVVCADYADAGSDRVACFDPDYAGVGFGDLIYPNREHLTLVARSVRIDDEASQ